jgi:predicted CopG family antitoxin
MGTKTIGIRDDVYKRLKSRKRDDESFTDLVDRILDETRADWQEGFGTLDEEEAEKLERAVESSREQRSAGLTARQRAAFEALSESNDTDETS